MKRVLSFAPAPSGVLRQFARAPSGVLRHGRLFITLLSLSACAARNSTPTTPAKVVEMEGLRIVATHDESGKYNFEAYDAAELFEHGNQELDAGHCKEAVVFYDRIASEFEGSKFVSPALYNGGLCLAQHGEREQALARFERLVTDFAGSVDAKHANFQAGHLQVDLGLFTPARERADRLLAEPELDAAERMEGLTMRAMALLGERKLDEAEQQAKQALTYYRTRAEDLAADPYFAAGSNYVIGEVLRMRAEALTFPDTNQEEQKAILVRRAQLLLDAMREYASTIQHTTSIRQTNPKWASASGYQIGAMYDKLWHDLMAAPIPASLSPEARQYYPQELAKLIKPLLRHAIRYWELTLMMAERTGAQGEWVDKTRNDLDRVRALMLEQPPGPGGLPQLQPQQPAGTPGAPPATSQTPGTPKG